MVVTHLAMGHRTPLACMPNPGRLKKSPPADDKLLEGRFRVELDTPRCFD